MTATVTIEGARRSVTLQATEARVVIDGESRDVTVNTSTSPVTITGGSRNITLELGGGGPKGDPGEDVAPSFETFAKNLRAYPASFGYAGDGTLETVAFTTPDGTVTKTLGYASGQLVTLTLSGALPSGIDTVKTLVYAGDSLASVSYS